LLPEDKEIAQANARDEYAGEVWLLDQKLLGDDPIFELPLPVPRDYVPPKLSPEQQAIRDRLTGKLARREAEIDAMSLSKLDKCQLQLEALGDMIRQERNERAFLEITQKET
jgi:hypothetical protein